jgi:hypothetical protein
MARGAGSRQATKHQDPDFEYTGVGSSSSSDVEDSSGEGDGEGDGGPSRPPALPAPLPRLPSFAGRAQLVPCPICQLQLAAGGLGTHLVACSRRAESALAVESVTVRVCQWSSSTASSWGGKTFIVSGGEGEKLARLKALLAASPRFVGYDWDTIFIK